LSAPLVSCRAEPIIMLVPFSTQDRSAIVAIETGGMIQLFAVDDVERKMMPELAQAIDVSGSQAVRVTAFFYDGSLDGNQLQRGPLQIVADGPNARGIPMWSRLEQATADSAGLSPWKAIDQPGAELSAVRLVKPSGCAPLAATRLALGTEKFYAGGGALDVKETQALLIVAPDRRSPLVVYEVDLSTAAASARRIATPAGIDFVVPAVASRGQPGALYVAGQLNGAWVIASGDQASFVALPARPAATSSRAVVALVSPPSMDDAVLTYAIAETGDVDAYKTESFAAPSWQGTARIRVPRWGSRSSAAWSATRDLYFVAPDQRAMLHFLDFGISTETVAVALDVDRLDVVSVNALGAFAGTEGGVLLQRSSSGTWSRLGAQGAGPLRAIAPFHGGFVAAFGAQLVEYASPTGACEQAPVMLGSSDQVEALMPLGDSLIAAVTDGATGAIYAAWIHTQR
jgi:hypothetical protein